MLPGDFFQIIRGNIVTLGNIIQEELAENIRLRHGVKLNSNDWRMSDGIVQTYCGKEVLGNEGENGYLTSLTRQKIKFRNKGSFYFHGMHPESSFISNWYDIKDELLIKLTQSHYSFREIYVVTESVVLDSWILAIASDIDAEVETITESEKMSPYDIISHDSTKITQCYNMHMLEKQEGRTPYFFKAKKLIIREEKMERFIQDQLVRVSIREAWEKDYFEYELRKPHYERLIMDKSKGCVLNYVVSNNLNINNVLEYYDWANTSMDDLEKLGPVYE